MKVNGKEPVGIIDIGSNSVRLVVFEGASRNPLTVFNEKVLAGIGRNIVSTGKLDEEGTERAIGTLRRFRAVLDGLGVGRLHVVATAAVRDASNGAEFVKRAEELCQSEIQILTGKQEAFYSAQGVLSSVPKATGLVADLGGGSLELISLKKGKMGQGTTLPIGALRLLDQSGGNIRKARKYVSEVLAKEEWLVKSDHSRLYAVGGAWRTLGRIHMAQTDYRLKVLQAYKIPADEARDLAGLLAAQSSTSFAKMKMVPRHRRESLAYSAVAMEGLLKRFPFKEVEISANGIREGLLFDGLASEIKEDDPLLRSARGLARRHSRTPDLGEELHEWCRDLFEGAKPKGRVKKIKRLILAACHMSNIAWRAHADHRGKNAFRQVLFGPVGGLDHSQRLFLALAIYHRYETKPPSLSDYEGLLNGEERRLAEKIGLVLQLGIKLSAGTLGVLPECKVQLTDTHLRLIVSENHSNLVGESLEGRLRSVASQFNRRPELKIQ